MKRSYFYFLVLIFSILKVEAGIITAEDVELFDPDELQDRIEMFEQQGETVTFESPQVRQDTLNELQSVGVTETEFNRMISGGQVVLLVVPGGMQQNIQSLQQGGLSDKEVQDVLTSLRQQLTTMGGQDDLLAQLQGVESAYQTNAANKRDFFNAFLSALITKIGTGTGVPGVPGDPVVPGVPPIVVVAPPAPVLLTELNPVKAEVDLGRLTEADKQASDQLFVDTLKKMALEQLVRLKGETPQALKDRVTVSLLKDEGSALKIPADDKVTTFDMYVSYIWNVFAYMGQQDRFKHRKALKELIGVPAKFVTREFRESKSDVAFFTELKEIVDQGHIFYLETKELANEVLANLPSITSDPSKQQKITTWMTVRPGSLGEGIYDKLFQGTKKEVKFLVELTKEFEKGFDKNTILNRFFALLKTCFFDQTLFDDDVVKRAVETLVINIVVSQRSDNVYNFRKNKLETEFDEDSPTALTSDEAALDELTLFFDDISEPIDKDYTLVLYDRLNRLRLNDAFKLFGLILGAAARPKGALVGGVSALQDLLPFLEALMSDNPSLLQDITVQVAASIKQQFFYDSLKLDNFLKQKGRQKTFETVFNFHRKKLLQLKGVSFDVVQFLNDKITPAIKTISDLQKVLNELKTEAGSVALVKDITGKLTTELKKIPVNLEDVVSLFKQLMNAATLSFESTLKRIVEQHNKVAGRADGMRRLLSEMERRYGSGENVSKFLLEKVDTYFTGKDVLTEAEKKSLQSKVKNILRIPSDIYSVFVNFAGLATLRSIVRQDEFHWIEPFGILMNVIKQAVNIESEESYQKLINSLEMLNKAQFDAKTEHHRVVQQRSKVVNIGLYKDKLSNLLKVISEYTFKKVQEEISTLVEAAEIKLEEEQSYKTWMNKFGIFLVIFWYESLFKEIADLHEGKRTIPTFERTESGGPTVYRVIKREELLEPLYVYLDFGDITKDEKKQKIKDLKLKDFDEAKKKVLDNFEAAEFTNIKEVRKKKIIKIFSAYFDDFKKKLENVVTSAQELTVAVPVGIPGVPLPPPGPPPPPPPV